MLHVRCLNRLMFEREDVVALGGGGSRIVLGESDARTKHVRKILKAADGAMLRVGVVDYGVEEDAVVCWGEDGSLELTVPETNTEFLAPLQAHQRPRVDVLLALPRPSNLERFLCTSAQQGIGHIVLCNAAKVQGDYFGSHMLVDPKLSKMRTALKEGLEQAGDTALPTVSVAKRLKVFLEDELDALCPNTVRVVAHPQKEWLPPLPTLREVKVPKGARILVAVGPEAGWQDPFELDLLTEHGFQAISLGERTLRTDVALISLVALAHDRLRQADAESE